jgi:hypothetical protein
MPTEPRPEVGADRLRPKAEATMAEVHARMGLR